MTIMVNDCMMDLGDTPSPEQLCAYTASRSLVTLQLFSTPTEADVKWQRILQGLHPVAIGLHVTLSSMLYQLPTKVKALLRWQTLSNM